jgi:hypothetical protein
VREGKEIEDADDGEEIEGMKEIEVGWRWEEGENGEDKILYQ